MSADKATIKSWIQEANTYLGIEFGSTRIKAVLIGKDFSPIAQGNHDWENRLEDGVWTYTLDDVWQGIQHAYKELKKDVSEKYDETLSNIGGIGISAMMHGYLAFDKDDNLLVPFRTWRNTITGAASEELTKLFNFAIPQRWSIAHLYQAILNKEEHVSSIAYLATLDAYVHWILTGEKVTGIGDAAGMFPIDSKTLDYDAALLKKFDNHISSYGFSWTLKDILPKVLPAGTPAGVLTSEGALRLDPSGDLRAGISLCPPEGDAGTGMVATNSVKVRTGNVSAGTSVFAMVVLEHSLKKAHSEIDMVTTPSGEAVAMVHCNNCTSDLNAWVNIFDEFAELSGNKLDKN
ncbi:MAG: ATPase, partial [Lachnospiraceae bacterium]|nr:ATPase [Lachnospiraceae bacterium]